MIYYGTSFIWNVPLETLTAAITQLVLIVGLYFHNKFWLTIVVAPILFSIACGLIKISSIKRSQRFSDRQKKILTDSAMNYMISSVVWYTILIWFYLKIYGVVDSWVVILAPIIGLLCGLQALLLVYVIGSLLQTRAHSISMSIAFSTINCLFIALCIIQSVFGFQRKILLILSSFQAILINGIAIYSTIHEYRFSKKIMSILNFGREGELRCFELKKIEPSKSISLVRRLGIDLRKFLDSTFRTEGDSEGNCVICYTQKPRAFFWPCRHGGFCRFCAMESFRKKQSCPLCRTESDSVYTFQVNQTLNLNNFELDAHQEASTSRSLTRNKPVPEVSIVITEEFSLKLK